MLFNICADVSECSLSAETEDIELLFCYNDLYIDGSGLDLPNYITQEQINSHQDAYILNHVPVIHNNYSTQITDYYLTEPDLFCSARVWWVKQGINAITPVAIQLNLNGQQYSFIVNEQLYNQLEFKNFVLQGGNKDLLDGFITLKLQSLLHHNTPIISWGEVDIPIAQLPDLVEQWYANDYLMETFAENCMPDKIGTYSKDWHIGRIVYLTQNPDLLNDCILLRGNSILDSDKWSRSIKDGSHRFLAKVLMGETEIQAHFCGTLDQLIMLSGANNPILEINGRPTELSLNGGHGLHNI